MAQQTGIEWTEATWNPIVGCSVISPGCKHCYAMKMAARIERMGTAPHYNGTTRMVKAGRMEKGVAVWTGAIRSAPAHIWLEPWFRKRPTVYFVNSMSDLFHEAVPEEWIDIAFAIMALCRRHTFQVLTKRSARMRAYMTAPRRKGIIAEAIMTVSDMVAQAAQSGKARPSLLEFDGAFPPRDPAPFPNVWLGVSTEDQQRADERIPDLLATPAAVRFISAEPLLGPIDLRRLGSDASIVNGLTGSWQDRRDPEYCGHLIGKPHLDWVIAGGESGKGARPMHPDWARVLRDQCTASGVSFFFKQWGEFIPEQQQAADGRRGWEFIDRPGDHVWPDDYCSMLIGKRAAGRRLDGRKWGQMPAGWVDWGNR